MNAKKIILSILGLVIIIGFVFVVYKIKNKTVEQTVNIEKVSEVPVKIEDTGVKPPEDFGKTITLDLNNQITFSDGLNVKLKEINDSRCPLGVECIWAGEISGIFILTGAKLTSPKEIRLGTVNNKSITLEGYTFSLKDATKTSVSIGVVKN